MQDKKHPTAEQPDMNADQEVPLSSGVLADALEGRLELNCPLDELKLERRLREAVAAGDEVALKRLFALPMAGEVPSLAESPLRSAKNRAIMLLTVISRAAIDAGVNGSAGLMRAEALALLIERARDDKDLTLLINEAALEFCREVQAVRGAPALKDELIAGIENYVQQHLSRSFTIEEMAQSLHFSHDYLMKFYKKLTGQSIMDYARRLRVETAKTLLIDGRLSGSEIAALTGFSSQSHLIRVFKREVGITPYAFQMRYEGRPFFKEGSETGFG